MAVLAVRRANALELGRRLRECAEEHRLATHATAIAFRILVALVPLAMLGAALLGLFGLEDVWRDSIGPELKKRLELPVFGAIDFTVEEIFRSAKAPVIAAAAALLLWEALRAVRAVSHALNEIHDAEETRPWWRTGLVTLALAVAVCVLVVGAFVGVVVGGRTGLLTAILRWPAAIVLLGLAVGLLLRYAPAERPEPRWASAGSAAIVLGWLALSVAFGWWVAYVADYKSAVGTLLAFLVLTAYTLGTAAVFVAGAELDELLRTESRRGRR